VTEYCIFCGKPIPESDYRLVSVVHRYCSTNCAQREQLAVRRLASTSYWVCQQPGCDAETETWCPLCEKFLCAAHDPLIPRRMHDCLGGPAEATLPHAAA